MPCLSECGSMGNQLSACVLIVWRNIYFLIVFLEGKVSYICGYTRTRNKEWISSEYTAEQQHNIDKVCDNEGRGKMKCDNCGNTGQDMRRCSGCYNVHYCSKECQKHHWKKHKAECKSTKPEASASWDTWDTAGADAGTKPSEETKAGHQNSGETGRCSYCFDLGLLKSCGRCKGTNYCCRSCQKKDWPTHKNVCYEQDDDDDFPETPMFKVDKERYMAIQAFREKAQNDRMMVISTHPNFTAKFPVEKEHICARRPKGSIDKAMEQATSLFPERMAIDNFDDLQLEAPLFRPSVLVVFIFRFHFNVRRFGVYLKDVNDKVLRVEFYFDQYNEDPAPYFSFNQVRPGNYICLEDACIHTFGDGTIGIRMDHPHNVKVLTERMLR